MNRLYCLACLLTALGVATPRAYGGESASLEDDFQGWLELGIGAVANGNDRFGQYSQPYQTSGLFAVGALGLSWQNDREPYSYGRLSALLSIDQIAIDLSQHRAGSYGIEVDYHQFEQVTYGDLATVYPGGGPRQVLPSGYSGLGSAQRYTSHAGVGRKGLAVELDRQIGNWWVSVEVDSEQKEGGRLMGASERFGDAVLLLAPIDYRHDSLEISARYSAQNWALNSTYYLSSFKNDEQVLTYANPINLSAPLRSLDTGPDNEFRRYSLDGYFQPSGGYQLSWYLGYGDARQNDRWLQPLLVAGRPLLDSLNAQRVDIDLRLGFAAQPSPRLGYRIKGEYRQRDNRTDRVPITSSAYAALFDSSRRRLELDTSYRLPGSVRVKAGLALSNREFETRSQDSYREQVDDERLWAEFRLPSVGPIALSLNVETSRRDTDLSIERLNALNPAAPREALAEYLLPGRSWRYGANADVPLGDTLSFAASWSQTREDFDNDYYGLRGRDSDELSLTLLWRASADVTLSANATEQRFATRQHGFEFHSSGSAAYANAPWQQQLKDTSRVVGVDLRWRVSAQVDYSLAMVYSENDSSSLTRWLDDADTGEAIGTEDRLPGWGQDAQRLEMGVDWRYSPRTAFKFRYFFEHFSREDWAWTGDVFSALALDWNPPTYDAHALSLGVIYQFAL